MFEKRWAAVPPQSFTVDGTISGAIKIAGNACHFFKVKQEVYLTATSLPNLDKIEIKKILDDMTIIVGPCHGNIHATIDISAYTVALGAAISANEQKRSSVPFEEFTRAVYEEEPTVANRTILVDECGDKYNEANPLPVKIPNVDITIGDLDVQLDGVYDVVDNPDPDNVGVIGHNRASTPTDPDQTNRITSVTYGEGGIVHALDVSIHNSNGSAIDNTNPLPVVTVPGPGASSKSIYNAVSSVANAIMTTILTYTIPSGATASILTVDVSGTNIAAYQVEVNATIVDKKYTYFSGALSEVFNFNGSVQLLAGDVVRVRVLHGRPNVGDFNARLAVSEQV
jgi:hypothetical protein